MNPVNTYKTYSNKLVGLDKYYNLLNNLLKKNLLPKVVLLTGEKGIGKFTMTLHFMSFFYDSNLKKNKESFTNFSLFCNKITDNLLLDIIYLDGSNFKDNKVENIRNLKNKLIKSSLNNGKRFIVIDEIEIFNENSLNALLAILEKPNKNDYFILINNKTKPLLETIKSRCSEFKIILDSSNRDEIINYLTKNLDTETVISKNIIRLTPGNYVKFNAILSKNEINPDDDILQNLSKLLTIYKKNKDIVYKDLTLFLIDYYLKKKEINSSNKNKNIAVIRTTIFKKIDDFFRYNLNLNTLISSLELGLINE